jgi:hypothetical protein
LMNLSSRFHSTEIYHEPLAPSGHLQTKVESPAAFGSLNPP